MPFMLVFLLWRSLTISFRSSSITSYIDRIVGTVSKIHGASASWLVWRCHSKECALEPRISTLNHKTISLHAYSKLFFFFFLVAEVLMKMQNRVDKKTPRHLPKRSIWRWEIKKGIWPPVLREEIIVVTTWIESNWKRKDERQWFYHNLTQAWTIHWKIT